MRFSGFGMNNRIKAIYSEKIAPVPPAQANPYGSGCPQAVPVTLLPQPSQLPVLGSVFGMTLGSLPPTSVAGALLIGFAPSNIDLTILGMHSCTLLQTANTSRGLPPLMLPATDFDIAVPYIPTLLGATLYFQGAVIAPSANFLGVVLSNGLTVVLGY
jgi:hypothetical protein